MTPSEAIKTRLIEDGKRPRDQRQYKVSLSSFFSCNALTSASSLLTSLTGVPHKRDSSVDRRPSFERKVLRASTRVWAPR